MTLFTPKRILCSLFILGLLPFAQASELGFGNKNTELYYHFPPDPVNVRTLNFFLPSVQLTQPCWIPIEIRIAYNSYSGDSSVFGEKWTFNHNIYVRNAVTHYEVIEGDGFVNKYTREKNLEAATKALVGKIIIAIKKQDAQKNQLKSDNDYKETEKRLNNDKAYREEMAHKLVKVARPLGPGIYYSLVRGQSELEKKADGTYIRRFQNGSKEIFNREGKLTRSEDRNKNYLTYVYQSSNLVRINDMCGRSVSLSYNTNEPYKGLINSIKDGLGRKFAYGYDKNRRLISTWDKSKNEKTEYRYDKQGDILEIKKLKNAQHPEQSTYLTYSKKLEVQSEIGPGDKKTLYKRSFIANDPNHSITNVTKYTGKVLIAREVHEYKVGKYENVTKFDQSGKEVSKKVKRFSKETGYPISILNETGQGDTFKYAANTGNLLERQNIPSGEKMKFGYETRCNQINSVEVDKPNQPAKITTYTFDKKCNVVDAVEKKAKKITGHVSVVYTPHGKTKFLKNLLSKKGIAFTYWQYGKPESITLKDVGTILVKYLPTGDIDSVTTFPNGKGKDKFKGKDKATMQQEVLKAVRSSLDQMLAYLRPAGLNIGL